MPSDGSNNLILLDRVKKRCEEETIVAAVSFAVYYNLSLKSSR